VKAIDPARIASFVERMDQLAKSIDPAKLAAVVDNAETFTKGLAGSTEKFSSFVADAQALAGRLKEMSERLDPTISRITEVAQAVDPQKIQRTVDNVERFTETLGRNSVHVDSLLKDAADVARKFNDMSARIDATVRRINDLALVIDPQKIDRTVTNIDKFSESLGRNSVKVDTLMSDASEIARKFNEMTPRIDRILANVEGLTGSQDGKGMLSEVASAAQSIRKLAENLDKRVAEISSGLSRFTGSGLREWEALASEGRRTLSELDRAIRNFDRNPQRVIFGGSGGGTVPQYGGRR
jgi:phospholipid/cholesterol/gamma-HCH transport system substrate-binding protein